MAAAALAAAISLSAADAVAQAVVFPQTAQPGPAQLTLNESVYTLGNDLLTATFVRTAAGHLTFGGCPELGLAAGTELFTIAYQDGTSISSGEINWDTVTEGEAATDPTAARASLKLPGRQIEAVATLPNGLEITWRAVLRDGSHYLRTEIELVNPATNEPVSMHSLTPMIYTYDRGSMGEIAVVGNTRGAILASPKVFAGLETPMGVNSVIGGSNTMVNNLRLDGWSTATDWTAWQPGVIPDGLPKSFVDGDATINVTADHVDGMHGYAYFPTEGEHTVEFLYGSGNIRIDLLGIELVNVEKPGVTAHDFHHGFTGGQKENNVYTLDIPEAGVYEVKIYRSNHSAFNNQAPRGTITWSGAPVLASASASTDVTEPTINLTYDTPALSTSWVNTDWATPQDYAAIPGTVTAMVAAVNVNGQSTILNQNTTADFITSTDGVITARYAYTGGSHARWYAGAELFRVEGDNTSLVAVSTEHAKVGTNGTITFDFGSQPAGTYRVRAYSMHQPTNAANASSNSSYTVMLDGTAIEGASASQDGGSGWIRPENPGAVPAAIGANFANFTESGAENLVDKTHLLVRPVAVTGEGLQPVEVTVRYVSGNNRLCPVAVMLVDGEGNIVAADYHYGYAGSNSSDNTYILADVAPGDYTLRVYAETRSESALTTQGAFAFSDNLSSPASDGTVTGATVLLPVENTVTIQGLWSRHTTIEPGKTWEVGAVVGLVAQNEGTGADQTRRSVLAYVERERAVPWRSMVIYNSWYELNIDRNNANPPEGNMTVDQTLDVVKQWHTNLYEKNGANINAFVWDDGWDDYKEWGFHGGFPNGFSEPDAAARAMGTGIGAWLGPVGGYGGSGNARRAYWSDKGSMRLSNPRYRTAFLDALSSLTTDYDFRFFKLDGISAQPTAYGPDSGYEGEENAEGIIDIQREVRKLRKDLYINTTVGTWASPFWFRYTDAVWRQDADWAKLSGAQFGDDREAWISYRDAKVHEIFITQSPLCLINNLMTHGVIVTSRGNVSRTMDYDGIVRETRAAFACGSGMVELYCDYEKLNTISRGNEGEEGYKAPGSLWAEIAECIKWQRRNADVLPDIHWVGGNPALAEIYGWASWNGRKATLALRNPKTSEQTYTFTLREALELPAYCTSTFTLTKAFADQANLAGLDETAAIAHDATITVTLPANSIYVFDGIDSNYAAVEPIVTPEIVVDNQVEFTMSASVKPHPGHEVRINKMISPEPIGGCDYIFEEVESEDGIRRVAIDESGKVTFLAPGETVIRISAIEKAAEPSGLQADAVHTFADEGTATEGRKVYATVDIPVTIAAATVSFGETVPAPVLAKDNQAYRSAVIGTPSVTATDFTLPEDVVIELVSPEGYTFADGNVTVTDAAAVPEGNEVELLFRAVKKDSGPAIVYGTTTVAAQVFEKAVVSFDKAEEAPLVHHIDAEAIPMTSLFTYAVAHEAFAIEPRYRITNTDASDTRETAASIDETGSLVIDGDKLTGGKPQTVTVTAGVPGHADLTHHLTLHRYITGFRFSPAAVSGRVGSTVDLSYAAVTSDNGQHTEQAPEIIYDQANNVFTYEGGKVIIKGAGTAVITVRSARNHDVKAECVITGQNAEPSGPHDPWTGIGEIAADNIPASAAIFTVNGRRVTVDASHLPAGIYIVRLADGRTMKLCL